MNNMSPEHLRTYFLSFGPALNIAGLEIKLGLPIRTLRDWMKGKRGLPEIHLAKVEAWARWFGYDETRQYNQFL